MIGDALVIVAAGTGERLKDSLARRGQVIETRKAFTPLLGRPMLAWTLEALRKVRGVSQLIVVLHRDDLRDSALCAQLRGWGATDLVEGGARRQDSVLAGLAACRGGDSQRVGVHDAARPLVSARDVEALFASLQEGEGALLVGRVTDTVKEVDASGRVLVTRARDQLRLAQTPQAASLGLLKRALERSGLVTDEAMALEALGIPVNTVLAQEENPKLTTAADIEMVEAHLRRRSLQESRARPRWAVGDGYDIHRLVEGRPLWIGGLEIPFEFGSLGHSDGDVVLHALVDALLGGIGAGDIGELFPDTDAKWKGAASKIFVEEAMRRVRAAGYEVGNVDITIHAERPKMKPYKGPIAESVRQLVSHSESSQAVVNVKAKTNEGLDSVGRREAIMARVVVLLVHSSL